MVNDWFYNECQNQFRPYGAIMIPPLRGYWDSAPTGLLRPERSRGVGYHFSNDFSAAHNTWKSRTGMSTSANDIEIWNIF
jgi:hypothetical protein